MRITPRQAVPKRRPSTGLGDGRVRLLEASSREEASGLAGELAAYAVEARIEATEAGPALSVPASDAPLACEILGLPPVVTPDFWTSSAELEPKRGERTEPRRWAFWTSSAELQPRRGERTNPRRWAFWTSSAELEPSRRGRTEPRRWAASLACRPVRRLLLAAGAGATVSMAAAMGVGLPSMIAPSTPGVGWSASGKAFHDDANRDGLTDRIVELGADGRTRAIWLDTDQDGTLDRLLRLGPGERVEVIDLASDRTP